MTYLCLKATRLSETLKMLNCRRNPISSFYVVYTETVQVLEVRPCERPRPLFIEWTDVLPHDLVKCRSRGIGCYNDRIALKFDEHLGSAAAKLYANIGISRLRDFVRSCGKTSNCLVNREPGPIDPMKSIAWVLMIERGKQSRHQQSQYCISSPRVFRFHRKHG